MCGTGCNLQREEGGSCRGRTQGSHQAELVVARTCPGKRPDVTRIKTTHTPCQTAGRMDGCRQNRGAIKSMAKRTITAKVKKIKTRDKERDKEKKRKQDKGRWEEMQAGQIERKG